MCAPSPSQPLIEGEFLLAWLGERCEDRDHFYSLKTLAVSRNSEHTKRIPRAVAAEFERTKEVCNG